MEENKRYVGIDLGKRSMELRFIDSDNKITSWNCKTDMEGRSRLLSRLSKEDLVGIEACSLGFVIAREIIKKTRAKVLVLNPGRLAVIFKSTVKTDAVDALKIARLLQRIPEEELPVVSIPSQKEERDRSIVSEEAFLKNKRTDMINRLHSIFMRTGIATVKKSDLKTKKKRDKTVTLLKGRFIEEAERLVNIIDLFEEQLEGIDEEVTKSLEDNELTKYVSSPVGIGPKTSMAFLAFIGDGSRFDEAKQVSNYVGFVPKVYISGKTEHYGRITKRGCSFIRRVAIQAAWAHVRFCPDSALTEKYNRLYPYKGKKKAIVAIARMLVELMWFLARNKAYFLSGSELKIRKRGKTAENLEEVAC